jgi:hypothetical protein
VKISASVILITSWLASATVTPGGQVRPVRGWLSDEQCARGRASGGVYTGNNPDCARQCVAKGAKIVLILPDQKQLLTVANQDAARKNIGDYVEVTGDIDQQSKTVHIDSLTMITQGRAKCDRPSSKKSSEH